MRPQGKEKGARCQPLTAGLGNHRTEAVLRPSRALPVRVGHNQD
mgnify:FL=1